MKRALSSLVVVAAAVLSLVGCGGPAADSQSTLLAGDAGASTPPPSAAFTGLWTGNGSISYSFQTPNGTENPTDQLTSDSVTIVQGTSSDIVIAWNGCNLPASVNAQVATITSGFNCTQNTNSGTLTFNFTTGTATVVQNVTSLNTSGTVTLAGGGETITGTFVVQEQLTKVGNQ